MAADAATFPPVWDAEGRWAAIVSPDNRLKVWDVGSGLVKFEYVPPNHLTRRVTAVGWVHLPRPAGEKRKRSAAGAVAGGRTQGVALGLEDGSILIVSSAKGDLATTLQGGHQRRVNAIAGRTDGTGVYTSGDDGVVVLWDLATGQVQGRFVADKKGVRALQLNHAETVLAVAGHSVRLFSVSDHRLIKRFTGHATPVRALAFHPDDSVLLSAATQDRFLNVWRTAAGKGTSGSDDAPEGAAQTLVMDSEPVSLGVIGNGTGDDSAASCVLAVGEDGRLYLWDAALPAAAPAAKRKDAAAAKSVPARAAIALVAAHNRKPGKASKSKVNGVAETKLPITAAQFVPPAVAGTAPRVRITRGSTVKPAFETLEIFPEDQTTMVEGELSWARKVDGGLLLADDSAAAPGGAAGGPNGVKVLGPADMALPAPQLPDADDATLAEKLEQLQVQAARKAGKDGKAGASPSRVVKAEPVVSVVAGRPRAVARRGGGGKGGGAGRPSAESLQLMVSQALRTDDRSLLEQCLAVQDPAIVRATVRRLPTGHVLPFLKSIITRFQQRPSRGVTLAVWIRAVLTIHTAYLMTVPDLPYKLSGLYQVVDHRLAVFKRLLALAGRLDLIMAQIAQRQELEPAREAPTTIYYASDDEADEAADNAAAVGSDDEAESGSEAEDAIDAMSEEEDD